tara:strand:- start:10216 stop:10338 length:123 start_codon:yes stop_codon:yes gene_type:complete
MFVFACLMQIENQIIDQFRRWFSLGKIIIPERSRIFDVSD